MKYIIIKKKNMNKILFLILTFLFLPLAARADIEGGCLGTMMYPNAYYGGWGVIFMPFIWLLIIGAAIYVFYKIAGGQNLTHHGRGEKRAIDILKERYARGEINKAQFEEMKNNIEK